MGTNWRIEPRQDIPSGGNSMDKVMNPKRSMFGRYFFTFDCYLRDDKGEALKSLE